MGTPLLSRLLRSAFFRERETLGFLAAGGAFLYVVSSLAISHEAIPSPFPGWFQAISLMSCECDSIRVQGPGDPNSSISQ
jgi:hypothetical protein